MGSRLVAAVIVAVGIGLLAWVGIRDNGQGVDTAATSNPANAGIEIASQTAPDALPPRDQEEPAPEIVLENYGPRRNLQDLDGWLNTSISSLDELDGKVVLVEMWTFGCRNCKARIPYNQSFYENYGRDSFEIVGVHAPEFNHEADIANIEQALVDLGVTWPVALDTTKKNFRAWQEGTTSYWPRTYLIDQNGDVRFDHIGEGKYTELQQAIESLLANPPPVTP